MKALLNSADQVREAARKLQVACGAPDGPGDRLKHLYRGTIEEGVPERFAAVLRQLDERERGHGA